MTGMLIGLLGRRMVALRRPCSRGGEVDAELASFPFIISHVIARIFLAAAHTRNVSESGARFTATMFFKMREEYLSDALDDPDCGMTQVFTIQNRFAENVRASTVVRIIESEDHLGPSLVDI